MSWHKAWTYVFIFSLSFTDWILEGNIIRSDEQAGSWNLPWHEAFWFVLITRIALVFVGICYDYAYPG
jgi:hypothetical protein